MTIQRLPNYGEMIYYITKYHIKYPLNIHNRVESTSKKGQTEVTQLILMQCSRRVLYEVEETCKYSKANKGANIKCESETT